MVDGTSHCEGEWSAAMRPMLCVPRVDGESHLNAVGGWHGVAATCGVDGRTSTLLLDDRGGWALAACDGGWGEQPTKRVDGVLGGIKGGWNPPMNGWMGESS